MKRLITIFLILLSVSYMLPISAMVKKENVCNVIDIEEDKDDIKEKEKKIELIITENVIQQFYILFNTKFGQTACVIPFQFHIVETPPPNFA